ncbi:MAG: bifunctional UDP-N-acetylglucosamine diphosphorylase/glucosamine-1-phosphate N-acetyltransferase GlmU [Firmicutes bacterium]|nr:bifunctional UDP-N-acetylglucosamine diphosphorylase/glucosamine-1-phosphate N-acetyltransferase GlmU [Bacillota bacterium]
MSCTAAIILLIDGVAPCTDSCRPRSGQVLCGKPMLEYVADGARLLTKNLIFLGGSEGELQMLHGAGGAHCIPGAWQQNPRAKVESLVDVLPDSGSVLVLHGNMPLLLPRTLKRMAEAAQERDVVLLAAKIPELSGYRRMIHNANGDIQIVVDDGEALAGEKTIEETDTGAYCLAARTLKKYLKQTGSREMADGCFFASIISSMIKDGLNVGAVVAEDFGESMKIDDYLQLAEAVRILRGRINRKLLETGVNIIDPDSTFMDDGVEVGNGTTIYPQTIVEGNSRIGNDCRIGPGTHLRDTSVGDGCSVKNSVAEESTINEGANIGPFAYLRPGTVIGAGVKIGNFVEVKNSDVGAGSKIPHLSYIGDADIGTGVNFGAGSIIVNYDGQIKHRTCVQKNSFIGCNSNLIAPIKIGAGSYVAAGSTLNKDVPAGALALGRAPQINKDRMAKRFLKDSND